MAGELGFEHHVIEGIWRKWTMEERREVVEYSRQQGVGMWFWRHTNQLRTPEAREEFFRMLRDLGVVGAKIDFFDHEAKEVIDLYEALLRKAAEHQHPARVSRREQADRPRAHLAERAGPRKRPRHGVERDAGARPAPDDPAVHALPRRAGRLHRDGLHRTPPRLERGAPDRQPRRVREPAAHDRGQSREHPGQPGRGRDQEHSVDVGRDDRAAGSEIGELVVFARRKGETWFLAVMCGPGAKTIQVPLSFLGVGRYQATLVRDDAPDGSTVRVESSVHTQKDTIAIELRAGGGFVGRFAPAAE